MTTREETRSWVGRTVCDRNGEEIGRLEHVYLSRQDDRPTWGVVVHGRKLAFVPLSDVSENEGALQISADADRVDNAPRFDPKEKMSPEIEERLSRHYGGGNGGGSSPPPAATGMAEADQSTRRDVARDVRGRQREKFGGFSWGADFFGWLVSSGLATILTAIVSAAGAAIGLTKVSGSAAEKSAGTISIVGGVVLLAVLMLAYFAGGYVAGRLARFDGARQGIGTWLIGLLVTLLLAGAGAVFGSKYNVLAKLDLPRLPVDEGSLATGGLIALAAILIGTLLAAVAGGKAGERFHRKVDSVGYRL
jgi:VIT1/CCC1 family predicted Fe2+/Mn2+ transporter